MDTFDTMAKSVAAVVTMHGTLWLQVLGGHTIPREVQAMAENLQSCLASR